MTANKTAADQDSHDEDAPDLSTPEWRKKFAAARVRRRRPPLSAPKAPTTIRLDPDVIEAFRAQGRGCQSRINAAPREWVARAGSKASRCNKHSFRYHIQMLVTGNQLRAARALAEVDQQSVADRAEVSVNTIRNMEARGSEPITSGAVTLRRVQAALEAAGVEFTNGGQPGVRMKAAKTDIKFEALRDQNEIFLKGRDGEVSVIVKLDKSLFAPSVSMPGWLDTLRRSVGQISKIANVKYVRGAYETVSRPYDKYYLIEVTPEEVDLS